MTHVVKSGGLPSPPSLSSEVLKLKLLKQIRSQLKPQLAPAPERGLAVEKQISHQLDL